MSAATKAFPLLLALAVAGCGGGADEQNFTITNEIPEDADIEVLPADESVAKPSGDPGNAAAEPPAGNGY